MTAAVAFVAFAAYLPSLFGPFQFDDFNVIVHNPALYSLGGLRPLLKATYALNWSVSRDPFGFHLFNILVHALNAALVHRLGRRLFGEGPALAAALMFALHPAQTEAVTYVCGRSSSLMASFYLGAALLYLEDRSRPALLLFAAALAVKESAVTLPAALLLLDRKPPAKKLAPFFLAAVLALLVMLAGARYRDLLTYGFTQRAPLANLLTQVNGVYYLLARLITLRGYNIDPGLPELSALTPLLAAQAAVLAAAAALALKNLRRAPELSFGVLWFLLHLAPTNSVVPRLDPANDRQLYLACWGPFLALAALAARALAPRPARLCAAAALLLFLVAGRARQADYATEISLWESSLRQNPANARAHNNLGLAYQEAGRLDEARAEYRTALKLKPDYTRAGANLRLLEMEE